MAVVMVAVTAGGYCYDRASLHHSSSNGPVLFLEPANVLHQNLVLCCGVGGHSSLPEVCGLLTTPLHLRPQISLPCAVLPDAQHQQLPATQPPLPPLT